MFLWIAEYIKMLTCQHKFEYSEGKVISNERGHRRDGVCYSLLCTKCGHHKVGWKFLK